MVKNDVPKTFFLGVGVGVGYLLLYPHSQAMPRNMKTLSIWQCLVILQKFTVFGNFTEI